MVSIVGVAERQTRQI